MVQEIIDPSEGLNYEVGDVVYLWYELVGKDIVLTCKSEVLEPDGEEWRFKPLEKQAFYAEECGIISFSHKPVVFAKETDGRRAENDTI